MTGRGESTMASSMWTPSLFHKIFVAIAQSDAGILGAMDNRSHTIAMNEFLRFMKANHYQKLGLNLTDLTDAFKFANRSTEDQDRNEMTEQEFVQCLLFTQARYLARSAPAGSAAPLVSTSRPPFDVSINVAAQLGSFLVALCGSKLIVHGGSGKCVTEVFLRTPNPSRPPSSGAEELETDKISPETRQIPDDLEEEAKKPLTQREISAFFDEMRLIFTRLKKRVQANHYLERIIAASKGGLNPVPSKSEQDERSSLTIEFRTAIHDMNEMNERVRLIDGAILDVDKQLKRILEERAEGVVVEPGSGITKLWISAEEENKLKLYEKKLKDKVNEVEKRIGTSIASNTQERLAIQEYRDQIMAIKDEITALDQVSLSVEFMTNQHSLLTEHILEEQRSLKDMQFEAIRKLKEIHADTAAECKKLEEQSHQLDARMQAVENELLEKPPDRATMNEIAIKKASTKLELKSTKAEAEFLEAKMKNMLLQMGLTPTYEMKEIESGKPFYYISNDSFIEAFQTFEEKAFKFENEITTKKMKIAQLETEISVLNEECDNTVRQASSARESQKEILDMKASQIEAAQAAVFAEAARFSRTESLLVQIEGSLAKINDKIVRDQPMLHCKAPPPVLRDVFVPPMPDSAHVRSRKVLEAHLLKLLGSRTTVLATDLLCNAGTVDLLCHDRRERLVLVCFANPLTGFSIDSALVSHCAEIQSAFYMLRRLPASGINALKNCFLETGAGFFQEILNARVHRFVIIGQRIDEKCDTSSFASVVELVKADNIGEVWRGEATKRALLGGVPSPEELSDLIHAHCTCAHQTAVDGAITSDLIIQSTATAAWGRLRTIQSEAKCRSEQRPSVAKISYQNFLDWISASVLPGSFFLPPDTTVEEVVRQFIIHDMKWSSEPLNVQEKRLLENIGPHAAYRYVAQLGEHISLFSACGVTFSQLSPSPPPPEADSGLEAIVEAWKAAASQNEASMPCVAASSQPVVPSKHDVAGGTWMVEAIARLVLKYIGCLPPPKLDQQQEDIEALRLMLKNSQKVSEDKTKRELKHQSKSSKKFEVLSHSEEFLLYGHQSIESQKNLKRCEDLVEQFLEQHASAISLHNAVIEKCLPSVSVSEDDVHLGQNQRKRIIVRPPSLSSSEEDESTAEHRRSFEDLFVKSKTACADREADPVDSAALRGELKSNSVAQFKDNVIRIDPSTKAGQHKRRFHSRVYVGTVHANLKFLPNRNWYPELHTEFRRSLQKFETLTKALSKIKGTPRVINLADEQFAEAKTVKLPKIESARASIQLADERSAVSSGPELLSQLTLLDHLLQLPVDQLRASSKHSAPVTHADLNQPIVQDQCDGMKGVSLFSSASVLDGKSQSVSPQQKQDSSGSPSRRVRFGTAETFGLELNPSLRLPQEADGICSVKLSKTSPRLRSIKFTANSSRVAVEPSGNVASVSSCVKATANRGASGDPKSSGSIDKRMDFKDVYGSARFAPKGKHAGARPELRPLASQRENS